MFLNHASAQTDPCSLTATRTIANGQNVDLSTWFSSTSNASGEVIDIGVGSTLTIDKSFTFSSCTFRCAENAVIVTKAGLSNVVLGINNSTLLCCNSSKMWKGIKVNIGGRIQFLYNSIYDAKEAISFSPGYNAVNNVLIRNNFIDNQIGIQVGSVLGVAANVAFVACYGNQFKEQNGLNDTSLGQGHVTAGIRVDQSTLTFGTKGSKNIFDAMPTGMILRRGAYAIIANADFKNMFRVNTEPFLEIPYEGTGIYVSSSLLTVTRISGLNCQFTSNAMCGIFTTNHIGEIKIERASFSGAQRYGIYITQSLVPAPVTIQDNVFNLTDWRFYSAVYCVRPPGNSMTTNSIIRRNQINVPDRNANIGAVGALIDIVGITGGSNHFEISNNQINSLDYREEDMHGIYVLGAGDNYLVQHNKLTYAGISAVLPGHDYSNLGITFDHMPGTGNTIYSDTVRSVLTSQDTNVLYYNHRSLVKCGIHVYHTNAPTVCNNDVDYTYRGIHFGEENMGTVFSLNKMRHHVYGLHCRSNASSDPLTNIGDQTRRENTWSTSAGDYIDGGVGAMYEDNTTPSFLFRVNAGITGHMPPSFTPSGWFISETGSPNACVRTPNSFEDEEILIAKGEYPYSTPAEDWDQQRHLWNKLLRNPGIEEGVTEVEDFMGDPKEAPSSAFLVAEALYEYEKAFYPDSIWQNRWNTLLANISAKQGRIAGLLTQLGLDTLNVDPDSADSLGTAWTTMGLYQDTLRLLVDTFISRKDAKLTALLSKINVLPSDYDWEKAWIGILNVVIRYGQGNELDSLDRVTLLGNANSCPADIGSAVHEVLAYLNPDDAAPFKGCGVVSENCTEERSSKTRLPETATVLFPNPAHERLGVLFPDASESGYWKILSASGMLMTQGKWNAGEPLLYLDVSAYSSGIYMFQTTSASGAQSAKKFAIIR